MSNNSTDTQQAINYKQNSTAWSTIYMLCWSHTELQEYLTQQERKRAAGDDKYAVNEALKCIIGILNGTFDKTKIPDKIKGDGKFGSQCYGKYQGLTGPHIPKVMGSTEEVQMRINIDTISLSTLVIPPFQRIPSGPLQMVPYAL